MPTYFLILFPKSRNLSIPANAKEKQLSEKILFLRKQIFSFSFPEYQVYTSPPASIGLAIYVTPHLG